MCEIYPHLGRSLRLPTRLARRTFLFHHLGIDASSISFTERQGRGLFLVERGEPIRELL